MRCAARVVVEARAKLNLALAVGPRRADGDHELATVFQSISLADTLIAERRRRGFSLRIDWREAALRGTTPVDRDIGADEDNLVLRAARRFAETFGVEGGARFVLLKRIPSRAGLGGGSADAAAALRAMAALYGLRPRRARLMALASGLGADVPFALAGGTAVGLGRGERLERLRLTEPFHAVLAVPAWRISTAAAFRRIDRANYVLTGWNAKLRSLQALRRKPVSATESLRLGNVFEDVLGRSRARFDSLSYRLAAAGLSCVRMTGSGSAVFGIAATEAEARRIIGRVDGREPLYLVRSTGAGHLLKKLVT
jgi:4-diphosphocytidyl-2-C-methyl-D-erythritol kinase